jgi:hypothetical protein
MISENSYDFCSEIYMIEKIVEVVANDKTFRIEALHELRQAIT